MLLLEIDPWSSVAYSVTKKGNMEAKLRNATDQSRSFLIYPPRAKATGIRNCIVSKKMR